MLVEMDFFFSHTVRCTLQHGAAWAWSHFFYYKAQGLQRPDNWCPVNLRIVWHGHMYRYILYTGGRSRVWFGGGRLRWKDLAKHQRDLSAIRAAFSLFIRFAARSAIILHDDDDDEWKRHHNCGVYQSAFGSISNMVLRPNWVEHTTVDTSRCIFFSCLDHAFFARTLPSADRDLGF